ncbi:MAG: ATP-dependent Clp protease adapter ClpS [Desulfococcus sp.]|nr:MAG: ATP-dependent Clp protease adapter ClpS [Desulfococcus sp.]
MIYDPDTEEQTGTDLKDEIKEPPMYRVLLHNDDYTTMEFVVEILMMVFHKTPEDATRIMFNVHKNGIGVCGVYTYDIAVTKVITVERLARDKEFPLKCSMEEE